MNAIGDKTRLFWATYSHEIILATGVSLISLISFASGYLYASQVLREPIEFEQVSISNTEKNM